MKVSEITQQSLPGSRIRVDVGASDPAVVNEAATRARRFTSKVHDGSEKAIYVVRYAFRAFLEAVTGEQSWEDPFSEECIAAVIHAIGAKPFGSAAQFLDALGEAGHLEALEGETAASREVWRQAGGR